VQDNAQSNVLVAFLLAQPWPAAAQVQAMPVYDAGTAGPGNGNAFTGLADDLGAVLWNPPVGASASGR